MLADGCVVSPYISYCIVVLTRNNPTPWLTVKPGENTKLMTGHKKFEKQYVEADYVYAVSNTDSYLTQLVAR